MAIVRERTCHDRRFRPRCRPAGVRLNMTGRRAMTERGRSVDSRSAWLTRSCRNGPSDGLSPKTLVLIAPTSSIRLADAKSPRTRSCDYDRAEWDPMGLAKRGRLDCHDRMLGRAKLARLLRSGQPELAFQRSDRRDSGA